MTAGWATVACAVTGCTLGQAGTFAGRAEATCREAIGNVGLPAVNADPAAQLRFALDRYTAVERATAEISSDISFPGGNRGQDLRRDWIDPAERSLRTGRDDLLRLRAAVVAGDRPQVVAAFTAARTAGTAGVNGATIRAAGIDACAELFTEGA